MMSFLQRFFQRFGRSRTDEVVPDDVAASESLTRFVFQSNHVNWTSNRLKPPALLPEPQPGKHGLETSVCRIDGIGDPEIWAIGKDPVGRLRGKLPIGRGDFSAQCALDRGLAVAADKQHFERHALLIKWPDDKEKRKAIALELSRYTTARRPS
jgi:hypothetical protein